MRTPAPPEVTPAAERRLMSAVWPVGVVLGPMLVLSIMCVLMVWWLHTWQIARLALVMLPVTAALLLLLGSGITRSVNRKADGMARTLRALAGRLEFQANHDALTGLPNRTHFEMALDAALRPQATAQRSALLYFDLDRLKVVNDTCGHAAGDEFIKQVAWHVRRLVGESDVLARLGGDEFGVLLACCGPEQALVRAEAIRAAIDELRFGWNHRTYTVSASIGVLPLEDGIGSAQDALSAADQACYLAKDNGRNRVQLYHADDQQVHFRRGEMHWVERLRAALDHDNFTLLAQEVRPLRRQATGVPRRFELLLRLAADDLRETSPMAFIPAAERYGLMPRIDRWVIARACRELAAMRARGANLLPVCMINLSGTSVSDPGLADYIADCLAEHHLSGSHIGFELTETAAVSNLDACAQLMVRLRQMGCCIALDDFGSGMSSFSYLRNLPIDLLKIDRSFIRDICRDPIDHAMVETIHRIGGIMGLRTVAEGVENAEQLEQLLLVGIDYAQGFHLHRPMPLSQVHEQSLTAQVQVLDPSAQPGALPGALEGKW